MQSVAKVWIMILMMGALPGCFFFSTTFQTPDTLAPGKMAFQVGLVNAGSYDFARNKLGIINAGLLYGGVRAGLFKHMDGGIHANFLLVPVFFILVPAPTGLVGADLKYQFLQGDLRMAFNLRGSLYIRNIHDRWVVSYTPMVLIGRGVFYGGLGYTVLPFTPPPNEDFRLDLAPLFSDLTRGNIGRMMVGVVLPIAGDKSLMVETNVFVPSAGHQIIIGLGAGIRWKFAL